MNVTAAPVSCSISAMWRCPVGLYGVTPPPTSGRCVLVDGSLPAPDTPDLPSIATGPSIRPARASGASARIDAVA